MTEMEIMRYSIAYIDQRYGNLEKKIFLRKINFPYTVYYLSDVKSLTRYVPVLSRVQLLNCLANELICHTDIDNRGIV